MKFGPNKMLGIAIGERSILIAEVTAAGNQRQVVRTGELIFAEGATLQQPELLGKALGQYLKSEGFIARIAVFGLPARWVLTKVKEVPPVDPALAADLLRLQVEGEFSSELKDLVFDYAGDTDAAAPTQVLLAATRHKHIEQIEAIAEAARLNIRAIVPTTLLLSAASVAAHPNALVISLTRSGVELAAQRGPTPSLLRHIGSSPTMTAAVAGEVRRALLTLPRSNGAANGNGNSHSEERIIVWDDADPDAASKKALADAFGAAARGGEWSALAAGALPAGVRGVAGASALAAAGILDQKSAVDFHQPRLAPPKSSSLQKRIALAALVVVVLLIGMIYAIGAQQKDEKELAERQADLAATAQERKAAEAEVAMIKYAQGWHADKPRYLDCVLELTLAIIPHDDQMYVTSFNLHESMLGSITGKATADKSVLSLVERLKASGHFREVKLSLDTKDARSGREVSFSITFQYVPHE